MSGSLEAYTALSSTSPRPAVTEVLQSIIDALPFSFDQTTRTELIKVLLKDLKACSSPNSKGRLSSKDAAQALLAVKTLGKNPTGSEVLGLSENLSTLLALSTAFKDDQEASSEALRCIANALLLIEQARTTFVGKDVGGGEVCVALLEKSTVPDQIFIVSRILFLCTASGSSFILALVEEKHVGKTIVEIIAAKLDILTVSILSGAKMAREAMSDILKLTFNLLLHYPKMVESEPQNPAAYEDNEAKVMGDFWNSKLDGILPPLLRIFSSLPPTFPSPIAAPLTHVIHSLIIIPISPSLHPLWFGSPSARSSANNSPKVRTPQRRESSSNDSPAQPNTSGNSKPPSPKPSTIDRALSVLAAGRRSLSRSPSSNTTSRPFNVLQQTCDLLDVSFSHYFPGNIDPDEPEVRQRCKDEGADSSLDDILSPLLILLSRLCIADEVSRAAVRQFLVPSDLDRSVPLEARSDVLGRCLRLLGSVYHPRLKDAVGEMLFAMSNSNPSTLSALVGYGNVAGFLFHKGILNAPPQDPGSSTASLVTPSGARINPITGTTVELARSDVPEMSEEDKEREMEKLFVLFDRLERNGAMPPSQNPIRKAIQEGKIGPGSSA